MLNSIWSSGTWPGPSTITCTPIFQARSVSLPISTNSASCKSSVASARPPGRQPSPMENVTSCSRMIAQMSSHSVFIRFSRLWISIHLASRLPPRDTKPINRFFASLMCSFNSPAWIVK